VQAHNTTMSRHDAIHRSADLTRRAFVIDWAQIEPFREVYR